MIYPDGLVKSRRKPVFVIPIKMGIQPGANSDLSWSMKSTAVFNWLRLTRIPACALRGVVPSGTESGMTIFYRSIKNEDSLNRGKG